MTRTTFWVVRCCREYGGVGGRGVGYGINDGGFGDVGIDGYVIGVKDVGNEGAVVRIDDECGDKEAYNPGMTKEIPVAPLIDGTQEISLHLQDGRDTE